jgi:hypothetical protein
VLDPTDRHDHWHQQQATGLGGKISHPAGKTHTLDATLPYVSQNDAKLIDAGLAQQV